MIRLCITIDAVSIENSKHGGDPVDIVYSNGVLKHITDLDHAVNLIQQVSHEETRQFHVVNFTDHVSQPDDPFREFSRFDPVEYFKDDSLVNLKRPSEIIELFNEASIPVSMVHNITDLPSRSIKMAPYWSRFDASDLAIQIAFFIDQDA